MNSTEILNALIKAYKDQKHLRYFGIRGDNQELEIGQDLDASFDWDYENDCQSEEKLSGTCATAIGQLWYDEDDLELIEEAIDYHQNSYIYDHLYLIGGPDSEHGADDREIIISQAEVICKIK